MTHPLVLIARKQRVGVDDTAQIELPLLLHLDAAKRGRGPAAGANFLSKHIIIGMHIAARTKSHQFYAMMYAASQALHKAVTRPTQELDLTTGEYQAIRKAFSWYLRSLPNVEVGVLSEACKIAERALGEMVAA